MGWRVRRSIRVGKGLRINLSKSGLSTSTKLGPVTLNSRRGTTIRVAKGLSYHVDQGKRRAAPPPVLLASGSTQRHRSCLGTTLKIIVIAIVVLVILGVIFG